ncbi:MAG: 3-deoxy-D-manno-octulosonic acid transferase, partial [Sedimentisphaerales bacterium]|nr:3-deoxy-D-manno-octulosonic acid transferase [Sedimentisphaerales bacterium]
VDLPIAALAKMGDRNPAGRVFLHIIVFSIFMKYFNDIIYLLALVAISPKILYRAIAQNRYRKGWDERLGKVCRKSPDKKCIWIHAVSVGEVNATKTIIAELKKQLSEYEMVISATTDTGIERAKKLYGDELAVFYFPFDFSFSIRRAFKRLRPSICLLMELEVWPNFTARAAHSNIPVVVVNGRISDRSFPTYNLVKPFVKPTFERITLFLAQSDEYAQRFIELAGRKDTTIITSSLKYDTAQITEKVEGADKLAEQLNIEGQRLLVAGGTGPNEEKIIIEAFKNLKEDDNYSDIRLAIVPRKPERFDEVSKLIKNSGLQLTRYSKIKDTDQKITDRDAVILGDTMGDLRKFYSLATVVFVGRSLVPMGGSDMMEPTAMKKPTIFGPHTFNFKQTVTALLAKEGAVEVKDGKQLYESVKKFLDDPQFAAQIAANGQKVIKENQGATQKTIDAIIKLLASQSSL